VTRVLVIHRDTQEAIERASRLRSLGFDATPYLSLGAKGFRGIRQDPPHAILIDLTRLPSYGKAMGVLLRQQKSLGGIPLVFVEGDPDKAAQVRALLPDAAYTTWAKADAAIQRAIRQAPQEAVPPRDSGTPLLTKLGIGEGSSVAVLHPPEGFALPGVRAQKQVGDVDVVLLFFRSSVALGRELPDLAGMMRKGRRVWVLWPKKASGADSDLTMVRIREMASSFGLVDYKVCAVDATWSAMTLGKRRKA
jgi:Protein of unknown function (DUF3052)